MTTRRPATALLTLMTAVAILASSMLTPAQQTTVAEGERVLQVRRALERLPYYGVFDFIAYSVEKGTVTLFGFAYRGDLRGAAEQAVKRVAGIDEVQNKIELLPASQNDDRIRWATFYNIYTDDFLSRYAPGGAMAARYDAAQFARFPGMQPYGGNYPIHIIVRGGRTPSSASSTTKATRRLPASARARCRRSSASRTS